MRVPESTNDTRTGSYHHPNKGQGYRIFRLSRFLLRELEQVHANSPISIVLADISLYGFQFNNH